MHLASHDDDTAEKVALMQRMGVTICEFPVTLEAAQAGRDAGLLTVMGAPNVLRGKSNSGNLSGRDVNAAGLLDMLAADYLPSAILPAVLVLAQTDPAGLPGALQKATLTPAKALGLDDRGEVAVGKRADLILARAKWRWRRLRHLRGGPPGLPRRLAWGSRAWYDGGLGDGPRPV